MLSQWQSKIGEQTPKLYISSSTQLRNEMLNLTCKSEFIEHS